MRKLPFILKFLLVSMIVTVIYMLYAIYDYATTPIPHKCIDPTHLTCDGNCTCDGIECGPYIIHPKHCMCDICIEATDSGVRDYIIKQTSDSTYIFNQDNELIKSFSISKDTICYIKHDNSYFNATYSGVNGGCCYPPGINCYNPHLGKH